MVFKMNKESKVKSVGYFTEAGSWARDKQDALSASRKIAWRIAVLSSVIALFEAIALMLLTPLKTAVPYMLMVDKQTGYVQKLDPLDPQLVSSRKALAESFLVQYVIAREGYDHVSLQSDYRKVSLWSSGQARNDYTAMMQASNIASPLKRYPYSTVIAVEVKSVTPLGSDGAMIRFQTVRHDADGHAYPTQHWVSAIRFTYNNKPMTAADRYFNPLGFEVLSYNRSAETQSADEDGNALQPSGYPVGSDNSGSGLR